MTLGCYFAISTLLSGTKTTKVWVSQVWREPSNHVQDCYFCVLNPSKRRTGGNAEIILIFLKFHLEHLEIR